MRVRQVTRAPLFPDDGPAGARLTRRIRGIGIEAGAFAALTLLSPVVLVAAVVVDLLRRRRWIAVRMAAFAWWFLFGELRGIGGLAGIYLVTGGPLGRGSKARRRMVYDLRIHWARSH